MKSPSDQTKLRPMVSNCRLKLIVLNRKSQEVQRARLAEHRFIMSVHKHTSAHI